MIVEAIVMIGMESATQKIKAEAVPDFARSVRERFEVKSEEEAEAEREMLFRLLIEEVLKSL